MRQENFCQLTLLVGNTKDMNNTEIDRQVRQLLGELEPLDIESVERVSTGTAPDGTKSGGALAVGALVVTLSPLFIPKLIEFLQAWTLRAEDHVVEIELHEGEKSVAIKYSPSSMSQDDVFALLDRVKAYMKDGDETTD